ncbi:MAG: endonuclease [Sphingobacteriales bacterium]|nr:MAG: endonuclease [Sphingobacteriales bacterium]
MPEGPSIVILKEEVKQFKGKKVSAASGNSKTFDASILAAETIIDFKTWGKHFLICFDKFTIRVHLMLFGSYLINEHKDKPARLHLQFDDGELNFYACSLVLITEPLDEVYDWQADIINPVFNHEKAFEKLKAQPKTLACDALLDQHIFSGSGNIIKNEVLFRIKVHPASRLGKIPDEKLHEMIQETVNYSFDFLRWKKATVLKKHWLAHTKKTCPRDNVALQKLYLGKTKRRSYFCIACQVLYK